MDTFMTDDEIKRNLGRKWRVNICYLDALCNYYRRHLDKALPISCNNSRLCGRIGLGCYMDLNRLLNKAVKLGLLTVVDDGYGFNHRDQDDNYPRTYKFDSGLAGSIQRIANVLYMLYEYEGGSNGSININFNDSLKEDKTGLEIRPSELPIISCRKKFQASYRKFVYDRYPQIRYVQGLLAEMNSGLEDYEHWFETSMSVNARDLDDDGLCNFSCRASSELCGIRKVRNIPDELCRSDLLNEYFGKGCWEEFDLNASIYRIARSCRDGKWYSDSRDIYEMLNGGPFSSEEERDEFKGICMVMAFSSGLTQACKAYRAKFKRYSMKHAAVKGIIEPVGKAVSGFCGNVDTDIFLHESCVMTMARHRLFERGIKAVQLYDCLFVEKGKLADFDSIVSECFDEYYRNYIK
jgi:hypothetical protein